MALSSSVTTLIPTGDISQWCLYPRNSRATLFGPSCPQPYEEGTSISPADFQGICCNGVIVDTSFDIYSNSSPITPYSDPNAGPPRPVNLEDLVCCGVTGVQTAAINFTPSPRTACAPGTTGTPLASLAATNVTRATQYPVTYADSTPPSSSVDASATVTNDLWGWASPTYGASGMPICFLANTKASGVNLAEVTVPATYLPPITSATGPGSAAEPTSSPSGAGSWAEPKTRLCLTLGLVTIALFII
ncbi:hypothetical protein F4813DRAFT_374457 [Daldinia decipiens]|uniref:uncharacterized protein n=1 Tax=Daldinia decipiens TaxID=326647 RepID=UPI0020C4F81E|nr:uncharacterized protein F4813DRAFT_374457 [Daldinia decipiens]KAI1653491.1 hypothetical protein F4813DRAFT_374457 [Daldinia decipiens]